MNKDTINQIKSTLIDLVIRFGPKLLVAILIMTVGVFIANWFAPHGGLVASTRT